MGYEESVRKQCHGPHIRDIQDILDGRIADGYTVRHSIKRISTQHPFQPISKAKTSLFLVQFFMTYNTATKNAILAVISLK